MENKKIRILVVFGAIANGGVEHIISDIFKNIDTSVFESEAVYHGGNFELEDVPLLKSLWPNMERAPEFKTYNAISYRHWWKEYQKRHTHFDIIHLNLCHLKALSIYQNWLSSFRRYLLQSVLSMQADDCIHILQEKI